MDTDRCKPPMNEVAVKAEEPCARSPERSAMASRFRGFLPVIVDVETGGFNPATDALLDIAAVLIDMQPDGSLKRGETYRFHVQPFPGANLEPAALQVTG